MSASIAFRNETYFKCVQKGMRYLSVSGVVDGSPTRASSCPICRALVTLKHSYPYSYHAHLTE